MTDKQIVQFVLHRAALGGQRLGFSSPKLVIYFSPSSLPFLAVKYNNCDETFLLRFTHGTRRCLFKLNKPINNAREAFDKWKKTAKQVNDADLEYSLDKLPANIKHYVSYAFIDALKTNGMGFDLFSFSYDDISIIKPNETYEEASIEADLMDVELNSL